MIRDDGDIIRACGYLAIYAGNLEDELDQLYELAQGLCPKLAAYAHLRFADKARHLRRELTRTFKSARVYSGKAAAERRVQTVLRHCRKVADARNGILHGSIFSDKGRRWIKSKRTGTRRIASGEVYDLANEIFQMNGAVFGLRFEVARLLGAAARAGAGSAT
jgi:hypothetical protein